MSDLESLRAQYKEVVGKNAFNGWDAADLQKRIDDHKAAANGGNDGPGAEPEKPAREPRGKSKEAAITSTDPHPSQADLDAMKDGTYHNREMKNR